MKEHCCNRKPLRATPGAHGALWPIFLMGILLAACSPSSSTAPVDGDTVADGDTTDNDNREGTDQWGDADFPDSGSESDMDSDEGLTEQPDQSDGDDDGARDDVEADETQTDATDDVDIPTDPNDCMVGQRVTITPPPAQRPGYCHPYENAVHWISLPQNYFTPVTVLHGRHSFWCAWYMSSTLLWCQDNTDTPEGMTYFVPPRGTASSVKKVALSPKLKTVYLLTGDGRLYSWPFPGQAVDMTEEWDVPAVPEDNPWLDLITDKAMGEEYPVLIQRGGYWLYRDHRWKYTVFPDSLLYRTHYPQPGGGQVIVLWQEDYQGFRLKTWNSVTNAYEGNITLAGSGRIQSVNLLDDGLEIAESNADATGYDIAVYTWDGTEVSRTPLTLDGSTGTYLKFYGAYRDDRGQLPSRRYAVMSGEPYIWYNDGDGWRAKSFPALMELYGDKWTYSIGGDGAIYCTYNGQTFMFSLDGQWSHPQDQLTLDSNTSVWISPDHAAWIASAGYPVMRLADGCTIEPVTCRPLDRQSQIIKTSISGWDADDVIVSTQEDHWVWRMHDGVWSHLLQPGLNAYPSGVAAGAPGYASIFTDHDHLLLYFWHNGVIENYLSENQGSGGSGPYAMLMRGVDQLFYYGNSDIVMSSGFLYRDGVFTMITSLLGNSGVSDMMQWGTEMLAFDGRLVYRLDEDLNVIEPPWEVDDGSAKGRSIAMGEQGPEMILDRNGVLWQVRLQNTPLNMYVKFPGATFIRKLADFEYIVWGPKGTVARFVLPPDYRE